MNSNNKNQKPKEEGNSQIINDVCLPVIPLIMLRYEQISNFYTEEPGFIRIKVTENDDYHLFEQVLRFRIWVPNQETNSWCIYSEDRGWLNEEGSIGGLVIRHAVWNRAYDTQKAQEAVERKNERNKFLNNWPTLELKNIYLNSKIASELIMFLKEIDKMLFEGIKLKKRREAEECPIWGDLEVMRLFDWGQVKSTWCPDMVNKDMESYVIKFDKQLKKYIKNITGSVYRMDLDYSIPLELLKALTQGTFK